MSKPWDQGEAPHYPPISGIGWLRVAIRGSALVSVIVAGLLVLLLFRLVERPIFGLNRPITPYITQFVCRSALVILGMAYRVYGQPMTGHGAVVANHSSWLDIFALNAADRVYFVSKSEVSSWPGIGLLARATGTVFIKRNPSLAREQTELFQDRLQAGHRLLFFPEGTSTDCSLVLPFKTTLFQSFFAQNLNKKIAIQPISIHYDAPTGCDARFYGWWGNMSLGPHLLAVLAAAPQGGVSVQYHDPLPVADFTSRKDLAAACQAIVQEGHSRLRAGAC